MLLIQWQQCNMNKTQVYYRCMWGFSEMIRWQCCQESVSVAWEALMTRGNWVSMSSWLNMVWQGAPKSFRFFLLVSFFGGDEKASVKTSCPRESAACTRDIKVTRWKISVSDLRLRFHVPSWIVRAWETAISGHAQMRVRYDPEAFLSWRIERFLSSLMEEICSDISARFLGTVEASAILKAQTVAPMLFGSSRWIWLRANFPYLLTECLQVEYFSRTRASTDCPFKPKLRQAS